MGSLNSGSSPSSRCGRTSRSGYSRKTRSCGWIPVVLDRLMARESHEIDLEDVKWVVLMVLFNQPGQEANFAWMEDLMFDSEQDYRH